jgi:hypothetical protein
MNQGIRTIIYPVKDLAKAKDCRDAQARRINWNQGQRNFSSEFLTVEDCLDG